MKVVKLGIVEPIITKKRRERHSSGSFNPCHTFFRFVMAREPVFIPIISSPSFSRLLLINNPLALIRKPKIEEIKKDQ